MGKSNHSKTLKNEPAIPFVKIFLSIRTFLCRSRFVLLSLYLDPIQVSVMGFGTVSLSSSLPKCVAFRLLLRFHGLSELLCLSCSFLVSAPLTYCSKKIPNQFTKIGLQWICQNLKANIVNSATWYPAT